MDTIKCPKCNYDEKGFFTNMEKNLSKWFTPSSIKESIDALKKGILCPFCHTPMEVSDEKEL